MFGLFGSCRSFSNLLDIDERKCISHWAVYAVGLGTGRISPTQETQRFEIDLVKVDFRLGRYTGATIRSVDRLIAGGDQK